MGNVDIYVAHLFSVTALLIQSLHCPTVTFGRKRLYRIVGCYNCGRRVTKTLPLYKSHCRILFGKGFNGIQFGKRLGICIKLCGCSIKSRTLLHKMHFICKILLVYNIQKRIAQVLHLRKLQRVIVTKHIFKVLAIVTSHNSNCRCFG